MKKKWERMLKRDREREQEKNEKGNIIQSENTIEYRWVMNTCFVTFVLSSNRIYQVKTITNDDTLTYSSNLVLIMNIKYNRSEKKK